MFNNKVALFQEKATTKEEALKLLSDALAEKGHVKQTFYDGLINREKEYPTGLQTSTFGIAIPHTDAIHVNEPQIAFMSLMNPVEFESMEGDGVVPVSIIIMLAMGSSHDQLSMLQKVVSLFQSKYKMNALYEAKDTETLEAIFSEIGIE